MQDTARREEQKLEAERMVTHNIIELEEYRKENFKLTREGQIILEMIRKLEDGKK